MLEGEGREKNIDLKTDGGTDIKKVRQTYR